MHYNSQWWSEWEKNCTRAASPAIRNEWDVCLALQEFQLKQLILDVENAGDTIYARISVFIRNQGAALSNERSLRRLLRMLWRHFALRVLLREMSARSFKHYCRANFPLQWFSARARTTAAIFMQLTWLCRVYDWLDDRRRTESQYARRCLMSTTRLAQAVPEMNTKNIFLPCRQILGVNSLLGECCQRVGIFTSDGAGSLDWFKRAQMPAARHFLCMRIWNT